MTVSPDSHDCLTRQPWLSHQTAMAVFQIWSSNMRSRSEPSEGLIRLSTQAPPRKHYSPQKIARNASHPSSDYQSAGGVYRRGRGRGRRQWRCRRSQGAPELETELLRKVFPVPLLLLTSLTLRKSRRFGESNFRSAVSILLRLTPPPPAASIH
nr:hypothetical protein Iba_chr04aCG19380 [Ipomoea batatas]